MRTVALDYGNRISLCEVSKGDVVARATVGGLDGLRPWVGPQTAPARVALEACREVWWVACRLREWGHEVLRNCVHWWSRWWLWWKHSTCRLARRIGRSSS
jgi:hypothetical protein